MADIEQLVLSISADTRQMQRALARLEADTKQSTDRVANNFNKINDAMTNVSKSVLAMGRSFVAGLVGAITFDAMLRGAEQTIKAFDEIGDQATRIGFTTDALQALRFELDQNGGKAEDANRALDRFTDQVGEAAKGSGELHRWLTANRVSMEAFLNLKPEQQLETVARMMAGLSTEAQRLSFATDIFGRQAGPRMVGTLQRIANEGFPAVIAGAKELGVVADAALIAKAQEVADAMARLSLQFQVTFGGAFVNAILTAQTYLDNFIKNVQFGIQLLKNLTQFTFDLPLTRSDAPDEFGGGAKDVTGGAGRRSLKLTITPNKQAEEAARRGARTADQEAKQRQKTIDDLKHEAEQLGRTNREQFIYNELKSAGVTATSAHGQEIMRLAGTLYDARQAQESLNKITQEYADIAKSALSGFIKDMRNGVSATEALSRALDRVTDRLIDMALNTAFAALFPGSGGGGAASGLIGALFGGGPNRAGGGPVQAGRAYTVGEQGPETFVPNVAGRIRPTDELTGSKSETISLNYAPLIDARGASVDAIRELKAEMARDRQAFQSRMVASIIDAKRRSVRI